MTLAHVATEAKLTLEQLLHHPIRDGTGRTIQWTPAQAKLLRALIADLNYELCINRRVTDDLSALNGTPGEGNGK